MSDNTYRKAQLKKRAKKKGIGLKKGQSLQLSQEIVKDRSPATLDNLKSNVVEKAVWSKPSKGPSLSQEALSKISKVIGPYSDKAKRKLIVTSAKTARTGKRLSRTSGGRQTALALAGAALTALVNKFEQAKQEGVSEVKVGGARFKVSPADNESDDPVARYLKANKVKPPKLH